MTKRNGAGGFRCLTCHTPLADVRKRIDGTPYLSIRAAVKTSYYGKYQHRLICPKCGAVRWLRWEPRPDGET